jgi:hypothetical protein
MNFVFTSALELCLEELDTAVEELTASAGAAEAWLVAEIPNSITKKIERAAVDLVKAPTFL